MEKKFLIKIGKIDGKLFTYTKELKVIKRKTKRR